MLGALIGAGSSLIGGLLGQSNTNKQQAKQAALQKEFAQNAIQWKAADAEKAGISKLFAMGAPTTSYAPVSTGGSTALGASVADAGQQIGRAMEVQTGPAGRIANAQLQLIQAQADGQKIDNVIKQQGVASSIGLRNQPGNPPAIGSFDTTSLVEGQGNAGVKLESRAQPSPEGIPQRSFPIRPEVDLYRTPTGWAPQLPQDLQEAMESDTLGRWQWNIRNKLFPFTDERYKTPPKVQAPDGYYYQYNPLIGQYVLMKDTGGPKDFRGAMKKLWSR